MTDRYVSGLPAAYGGAGWSPRLAASREEIGTLWAPCGIDSEYEPLRRVLLHHPSEELENLLEPGTVQMLALPDAFRARQQHETLARAYEEVGVRVRQVAPAGNVPPNLMFVADLMFMTPEGAIVGRPASTVRAGEERHIARRLAALGVPILRTVRGGGTFEGADAMWLDPRTVLLGRGLRTNVEGAAQVTATLEETGVEVIQVDLPYGTMHLMGQLRLVDSDLAFAWPRRLAFAAVEALRSRGYSVHLLPETLEEEAQHRQAFNFVTLGPRRVLMPSGCPRMQSFLERFGVDCKTVEIDELVKAAGGIGCLTGIIQRRQVA